MTFIGQRNRAGGAAEYAYADPILEARDGATDRRLRQAERLPRTNEAPRLHDRSEDAEPIERTPIEPHEASFSSSLGYRVCTCGSLDTPLFPHPMRTPTPRPTGHRTHPRPPPP